MPQTLRSICGKLPPSKHKREQVIVFFSQKQKLMTVKRIITSDLGKGVKKKILNTIIEKKHCYGLMRLIVETLQKSLEN